MTTNDDKGISDVEYEPREDAYRATFDPDAVSVNAAVIESLSAVLHRDPLEIDPLYEYVDTDALDAIVRSAREKASPHLSVSFRFEDADVTVHTNGTLFITPEADSE